ncbi:MAG TPA: hypothetical protein VF434_11645, partial [Promineifilum sp.]
MKITKPGFHVAANCGGCTGIDNHHETLNADGLGFVVYSTNDGGLLTQAAKYQHATLVWRDVEASTFNPADYGKPVASLAKTYWGRTLDRVPVALKTLRGRLWVELLNEPGNAPEQAAYIGALMHELALLALRDGWRVMGPGWATGNPEPEAWTEAGWQSYLKLCELHPEQIAV